MRGLRKSGRFCQKPRPGSRGTPRRSRNDLLLHRRAPGHDRVAVSRRDIPASNAQEVPHARALAELARIEADGGGVRRAAGGLRLHGRARDSDAGAVQRDRGAAELSDRRSRRPTGCDSTGHPTVMSFVMWQTSPPWSDSATPTCNCMPGRNSGVEYSPLASLPASPANEALTYQMTVSSSERPVNSTVPSSTSGFSGFADHFTM